MINPKQVFIVAELSSNHKQSFSIAKQTIEAMKESGADAVKFQTYTPDTITIDSNNSYFKLPENSIWKHKTLYELYKESQTPWSWHEELKTFAESIGLMWFSTPYDKSSVDFLERINTPMYKIASFEITDTPLIEYIASKNKPILISTGAATFEEIDEALKACTWNNNITLLKCTSSYPTPYDEINLLTLKDMGNTFGTKVGISDHTLGSTVPVASVVLGATVIEKHFILDRKLNTPDAPFSMEPDEFKEMVTAVRNTEKLIGKVNYEITDSVKENLHFKRSLFVVQDIKKGEKFTENNVKSIRPFNGIHPKFINIIIDKKASSDLKKGTPLCFNRF